MSSASIINLDMHILTPLFPSLPPSTWLIDMAMSLQEHVDGRIGWSWWSERPDGKNFNCACRDHRGSIEPLEKPSFYVMDVRMCCSPH